MTAEPIASTGPLDPESRERRAWPARGSDRPAAIVQPLRARGPWQTTSRLPAPTEYVQGALALSYPLDTRPDSPPADPQSALPRRTRGRTQSSALEGWSAAFVQAVIEVISSDRPPTQLMRWTSRGVYLDVLRRRQRCARRLAPGRQLGRQQVATVRVSQPDTTSAEVSARVVAGSRSRAIAARLDLVRGRWQCTALAFG